MSEAGFNQRQFIHRLIQAGLLTRPVARSIRRMAGAESWPFSRTIACVLQQQVATEWQLRTLLSDRISSFRVDGYRIESWIGSGGGGQVFRALDLAKHEHVAIKFMHACLTNDRITRTRFEREARASLRLDDPHIVRTIAIGQMNDVPYLVSEYVAGCDLRQLIQSVGPLPPAPLVCVARQIAAALSHVHDHQIIHRDVKPSNLRVTNRGDLKLIDLGLARFVGGQVAGSGNDQQTLTVTHQILGTVDYMSPEQVQDSRLVDERSDLYSLGCTLYFCATGRIPFPGENVSDKLVHRLLKEPVPIESQRSDLHPSFTRLVSSLLKPHQEARPRTAAEVLRQLDADNASLSDNRAELGALVDGIWQSSGVHEHTASRLSPADHSTIVDPSNQQHGGQPVRPNGGTDSEAEITIPAAQLVSLPENQRLSLLRHEPRNERRSRHSTLTLPLMIAAALVLLGWRGTSNGAITIDLPDGATVELLTIDKRVIDPIPDRLEFTLPIGSHEIELHVIGYQPVHARVAVRRWTSTPVEFAWTMSHDARNATRLEQIELQLDRWLNRSEGDKSETGLKNLMSDLAVARVELAGTAAGQRLKRITGRLPTSVDQYSTTEIARQRLTRLDLEHKSNLPAEVVAIVGDQRLSHWNDVTQIAFSPDTKYLYSVGLDRTLRKWNADSGILVDLWELDHDPFLLGVDASGQHILAVSSRRIQIRMAETGQIIHEESLPVETADSYTAGAVSADRSRFIVAQDNGYLHLWSFAERKSLRSVSIADSVHRLEFGPDNTWIAYIRGTRTQSMFVQLEDSAFVGQMHILKSPGASLAISPRGQVAIAEQDGTFGLYRDLWDDNQSHLGSGVPEGVRPPLAFSHDGHWLLTSTGGYQLMRYDISDFAAKSMNDRDRYQHPEFTIETLPSLFEFPRSIVISDDSSRYAVIGRHHPTIELKWLQSGEDIPAERSVNGYMTDLQLDWREQHVLATSMDGRLCRLQLNSDWFHYASAPVHLPWFATPHPNDSRILVDSHDELSLATDWQSLERYSTATLQPSTLADARWFPSGRRLVALSHEGNVSIINAVTGQVEREFSTQGMTAGQLCVAPDESRIAVTSLHGELIEFQLADSTTRVAGSRSAAMLRARPMYSPTGDQLAVATADGIRILNTRTLEMVGEIPESAATGEPRVPAICFAYHPDGKTLVSAGHHGKVTEWTLTGDTPAWNREYQLGPVASRITCMCYSRDGRFLLTANGNGTVSILELERDSAGN